MGGSCCKSSGDNIEIKFSKTNTSRIRENHNKQKTNRSNKYEENKENLINDIYKKSINNFISIFK